MAIKYAYEYHFIVKINFNHFSPDYLSVRGQRRKLFRLLQQHPGEMSKDKARGGWFQMGQRTYESCTKDGKSENSSTRHYFR